MTGTWPSSGPAAGAAALRPGTNGAAPRFMPETDASIALIPPGTKGLALASPIFPLILRESLAKSFEGDAGGGAGCREKRKRRLPGFVLFALCPGRSKFDFE